MGNQSRFIFFAFVILFCLFRGYQLVLAILNSNNFRFMNVCKVSFQSLVDIKENSQETEVKEKLQKTKIVKEMCF